MGYNITLQLELYIVKRDIPPEAVRALIENAIKDKLKHMDYVELEGEVIIKE